MNTFKTQPIREKYHVNMQEEYILGMVSTLVEPVATMSILALANKQQVMSPATTHKYLSSLYRKKFVIKTKIKEDNRSLELTLSSKGKRFLEETKNGYVGK